MALNSDTHLFKGSASRLIINVAIATLCRLVLNTARRFVYPFAPLLSRGLGVPLTAITSLIAINWATTIIAMFFGPITDRIGYRFMMILGVTLLALGMFTAYFLPIYGFLLSPLLPLVKMENASQNDLLIWQSEGCPIGCFRPNCILENQLPFRDVDKAHAH